MTVALLDGDIIAYRASVAAQEDTDWGDGQTGLTVNTRAAVANAENIASKWVEHVRADSAIVCLSPPDRSNFRKHLGDYKDMEVRSEKPVAYWDVVAGLVEHWECISHPFLEADDTMGVLATGKYAGDSVIVSIDKDMRTIPARVFDPVKLIQYDNSEVEADRFWMTQCLTGDAVDGYKGCPGIGPKKAEKLLSGCKNLKGMWMQVSSAYAAAGQPSKYQLLQARLSRILRAGDYREETGEIRLWHPKKDVWKTFPSGQ